MGRGTGVVVDRSDALEILEDRCASDAGAVVGRLLARLRHRSGEVMQAVGDVPLRVRIVISDPRQAEGWVLFTRGGNVASVSHDVMLREGASADLLLQGSSHAVLSAVLGLTPPGPALEAGVLIPMVPMDRLAPLLELIRAELADLATAYRES